MESLVRQTATPKQVLVIDNNPSGSSREIVRRYHSKLPVLYAIEKNSGVPHARNMALSLCQTRYISFIDDDCVANGNWVMSGFSVIKKRGVGYIVGRSLCGNAGNVVSLAKYIHQSFWFQQKLKPGLQTSPFNVDTKNITFDVRVLRKKHLSFDPNLQIAYVDSADTDLGFQMEQSGITGAYAPAMIVYHEEFESLKKFLMKAFYRGRLAYRLTKKWMIKNEFVYLPYINWFTYFKSIRRWPDEYNKYMQNINESFVKKLISFFLIKTFERTYLYGYLHEMPPDK